MVPPHNSFDCIVIGAGPAGLSAASWLGQMGYSCLLLEKGPQPCMNLLALEFAQDWVLGRPTTSPRALAHDLTRHALAQPDVQLLTLTAATGLTPTPAGWRVHTEAAAPRAGEPAPAAPVLLGRSVILATGVVPVRPPPGLAAPGVQDAFGLTAGRDQLPPGRVLLLGGGDNALENALHLARRGHRVTLWSRSPWRGQQGFVRRLATQPTICQRPATVLPHTIQKTTQGDYRVDSKDFGAEYFDAVFILFGFTPEIPLNDWAHTACDTPAAAAAAQGLFAAGDFSQRWHPCIQTALADGVAAAKAVQDFLAGRDGGCR